MQILPQSVWCLLPTRRFCPSHMMWHNLWPQTQNIPADVNTFSFHFLNTADQAKFHFTEKATFFPGWGEERNWEGFRRDSCASVHLVCNFCNFPRSQACKAAKCEFAVGVPALGPCLTAVPALLWSPLARGRSVKRHTPGKSCKSETRNLYKHFAALKNLISRCRVPASLLQFCKSIELNFMINT